MVDELDGGIILVTQEDDVDLDEGAVGQAIHDGVPDLVVQTIEQISTLVEEPEILVITTEQVSNLVEGPEATFVTEIVEGPQGPAGSETFERIAATTVNGHRAVSPDANGEVAHADLGDSQPHRPIWLSQNAAMAGGTVAVRAFGLVSESSWAWDPGEPVWVGPGGVLTQTMPTSVAVSRLVRIGTAVTSTLLNVDVTEPIVIL